MYWYLFAWYIFNVRFKTLGKFMNKQQKLLVSILTHSSITLFAAIIHSNGKLRKTDREIHGYGYGKNVTAIVFELFHRT